MKQILFFMLMVVGTLLMSGTERYVLDGILPPESISVDQSNLYISSGLKVSIFRLSDMKYIRSFGKKGEGPGEFINLFDDLGLVLNVLPDKIFINSRNRITYYSKEGRFINEFRVRNGALLKPVGGNYVGFRRYSVDNIVYNFVTLYDKNFKVIKDIYREKYWYQQGKEIDPVTNVRPPLYHVFKGRIYTKSGNGNIHVLNSRGDLIGKTDVTIGTQTVTDEHKRGYHEYYRTHPLYKKAYAQLKALIKFPKHFPKINHFDVADGCVYVFTYIRKGDASELYIFDLMGKLTKKTYLEMPDIDPHAIYPLVKVRNRKIYQIIENDEDEDAIDLHVTKIE